MSGSRLVSIIIPSYKSRRTVGATLDSLKRRNPSEPVEITVVDSSQDGTGEWIKKSYPEIRVIESPERLYPGSARNLGARECRGSYLAFLDSDVILEPDWLNVMLNTLHSQASISLTGGWVGNANPKRLASRILHWIEFSEALPNLPSGPRTGLASCNWLIRRSAFEQAGGFDEAFSMSEDMLLSGRLPGQIYFQNLSGVWHTQRVRMREVCIHLTSLGYWSGRHRRSFKTEGSFLSKVPWASFGLPLFRGYRITRRVFQSSWEQGLLCLALSPFLLLGLGVWTWGFYRGLTDSQ